jgi:hypothetical protein
MDLLPGREIAPVRQVVSEAFHFRPLLLSEIDSALLTEQSGGSFSFMAPICRRLAQSAPKQGVSWTIWWHRIYSNVDLENSHCRRKMVCIGCH